MTADAVVIGAGCAGLSAADAAHNERAWTQRQWPRHLEICTLGYGLLAQCWATDPNGRLADPDRWEDRLRAVRSVRAPREG